LNDKAFEIEDKLHPTRLQYIILVQHIDENGERIYILTKVDVSSNTINFISTKRVRPIFHH